MSADSTAPWPIPESVRPIPPGRVKERPWWGCQSMTPAPGYSWETPKTLYFMLRRDGACVQVTLGWNYSGQRIDALSEQVQSELLPHLAAYDRDHPRPRPPYRAGQVWGLPDGGSYLCLSVHVGVPALPNIPRARRASRRPTTAPSDARQRRRVVHGGEMSRGRCPEGRQHEGAPLAAQTLDLALRAWQTSLRQGAPLSWPRSFEARCDECACFATWGLPVEGAWRSWCPHHVPDAVKSGKTVPPQGEEK